MDKVPILESWKAIAAHLRRNVRTCQLWEREHGLPIHRLDGSPKARVFAYPGELDLWLHEKLCVREKVAGKRAASAKSNGALPTLPRWSIGLVAGLTVVAVAAVGTSGWLLHRQAEVRWANDVAIPEIERLLLTRDRQTPFDLLSKAERIIPRSPRLASLRPLVASTVSFTAARLGIEVLVRDYAGGEDDWERLGRCPVTGAVICQGYKRWKAEIDGRLVAEGTVNARPGFDVTVRIPLDGTDPAPEGMVLVRGGRRGSQTPELVHVPEVTLRDFFIDKHEVTNGQFKAFVDAGGYREPRFWKIAFVKDGRLIPWAEGVKAFVDTTGRPGPATWRLGSYPEGQADFPVSGVSWYEAAAYAEFAGKTLPSILHWEFAAGNYHEDSGHIIKASNFDGSGPARAGAYDGVGPFGTYDMAGNVKEWCWNDVGGQRILRGGAWNEPQYLFDHLDSLSPFVRSDNFGFRCMRELVGSGPSGEAFSPVSLIRPNGFERRETCSDKIFEVFRALYAYPKRPLTARVEPIAEWSERTSVEKVSIEGPSEDERVTVYLFLPRHGIPPYQTVVYFPGDPAWYLDSVFDYGTVKSREVELFTESGRAFVFPVYDGTFERRWPPRHTPPSQKHLEQMVRWYRDMGRCLDYLETRPEFDMRSLAYQGLSGGGARGVVFVALDRRIKAAVLVSGGLFPALYVPAVYQPATDPINFGPRVRVPVLMQNGKYDYMLPWDGTIKRMFDLLGTRGEDKRLVPYESGHSVWLLNEYRKEMFDFLDRYLGKPNNQH